MEKNRMLKAEGSFDYDYVSDILFFKVNDREYSHSIELLDYVIDFDTKGFIVGMQIFDASNIFNISKASLRAVKTWKLEANIRDNVLEVKLLFNSIIRNQIVEKNPILVQRIDENIPNSSVLCTA